MASEDMSRVGVDDLIAAVGHGAVRALTARQRAASANNGFYLEVLLRCGEPPVTDRAAVNAVEEDLERGPRPIGPPRKD